MNNKRELEYILRWAKKIKAINLLGGKCVYCGETNIAKLIFYDSQKNTNGLKSFNEISEQRWSIIDKKVKRSILLCSNCHREEIEDDTISNTNKRVKLFSMEYKKIYKCQRCNYDKSISSLDFHHVDKNTKVFGIHEYSGSLSDIQKLNILKKELDKCEVLCSNCHKEIEFDYNTFNLLKDKIYEKIKNIKEIQPPLPVPEVLNMFYEKRMKQIDIAKHFNASKGTISGIIKKHAPVSVLATNQCIIP